MNSMTKTWAEGFGDTDADEGFLRTPPLAPGWWLPVSSRFYNEEVPLSNSALF
jgi:hypothetical protein